MSDRFEGAPEWVTHAGYDSEHETVWFGSQTYCYPKIIKDWVYTFGVGHIRGPNELTGVTERPDLCNDWDYIAQSTAEAAYLEVVTEPRGDAIAFTKRAVLEAMHRAAKTCS